MELKNTGFLEQAPRETDFIAGSAWVTPLNHPTGDWFNSLPSNERQSGVYFDSMACFPHDAPVLMEDYTLRPIANIKVGEYVITHTGTKKRVTDVMKREHDGTMVEIDYYGSNRPLVCTPNHPILTQRGWIKALDIQKTDLLTTPKLKENTSYAKFSFEKDPDYLWLLGLYMAEGSLGKKKEGKVNKNVAHNGQDGGSGTVSFTIHQKETDIADRIESIVKRLFGINLCRYAKKSSKALNCYLYSGALRNSLYEHGGVGSQTKSLAARLLEIEPSLQLEIAKGWLRGDGHISENGRAIVGVSISRDLINQMAIILLRNGIKSSQRVRPAKGIHKEAYELHVYGDDVGKLSSTTPDKAGEARNQGSFIKDGDVWIKIKDIRVIQRWRYPKSEDPKKRGSTYIKNVYNIEVDGDHSYIAYGVSVHNCVSFSAVNVIETQLNWMLSTSQIPENIVKTAQDLGYIKDGVFNFSDRFVAKISGTTRSGNYLVAVWDAIRKNGLIPESDWNFPNTQRTPVFDWDDYYAPIPQALLDKGKKFLDLFEVRYEWLVAGGSATPKQFREWLKGGPIQIASATCPGWNSGTVPNCSLGVNHATMLYNVSDSGLGIFDQYDPFTKTLASDYRIPYAMRAVVTVKSSVPPAVYDPAFASKFNGQMVLAVEDNGSLWYITGGKRVKIGRKPEEVDQFLKLINEKKVPVIGMTNASVAKIEPIS